MAVLRNNDTRIPYLSDNKSLSLGLNPLGMRNAGEVIYQTLLMGLNNVTQRIRYYSFYCWLLDKFYSSRQHASVEEFRKFLRRSEYLLALIEAVGENAGGVPGITFAQKTVADYPRGPFDLGHGADDTSKSFWSNAGGVLSQYYYASLEQMGLVGFLEQHSRLPNIFAMEDAPYIDGGRLSEAVSMGVPADMQQLFLDCVARGTLTYDDIMALRVYFNMKDFSQSPKERELLVECLLQKDEPQYEKDSYHRHNTIKYLLRYANDDNNQNWDNLTYELYRQYRDQDNTDETSLGWFDFYLNDNFQYDATNIWLQVLELIKSEDGLTVSEVSERIADEMTAPYASKSIEDALAEVGNEMSEYDDDLSILADT